MQRGGGMRDPAGIIPFGKRHKGKHVSDPSVPDDYVAWLATKPSLKSKTNSFKTVWTCSGPLWNAAMIEADKRGWKPEGEKWVRKGYVSWED